MALVACPECAKQISTLAACPHCGYSTQSGIPYDVAEQSAALRTLLEDDEEEQRETGEYLQ